MHYADLTPHTYTFKQMSLADVLNVGWLENGQPYTRGEAPPGFLDALRLWVKTAVAVQHRGLHFCDFCPAPVWVRDPGKVTSSIVGEAAESSQVILVRGEGVDYACPALIVHYVEVHGYLPPPSFVSAVLSTAGLSGWDAKAALGARYTRFDGR